MKRELPPIAKRAAQVLTCIEESVMRFGRAHRYSVGADLRREAMQVSRSVHRAWNERSRQRQRLIELATAIDDLRITLQLAQSVNAFRSFREFEAIARLVDDLGRQCGGWLRQPREMGQSGRTASTPDQRAPILSSRSAFAEATP